MNCLASTRVPSASASVSGSECAMGMGMGMGMNRDMGASREGGQTDWNSTV